jgi:hypothetical protein
MGAWIEDLSKLGVALSLVTALMLAVTVQLISPSMQHYSHQSVHQSGGDQLGLDSAKCVLACLTFVAALPVLFVNPTGAAISLGAAAEPSLLVGRILEWAGRPPWDRGR